MRSHPHSTDLPAEISGHGSGIRGLSLALIGRLKKAGPAARRRNQGSPASIDIPGNGTACLQPCLGRRATDTGPIWIPFGESHLPVGGTATRYRMLGLS